MKFVKITLSEPIVWGSETITELTLKPMKGKDLRGMPLDPGFDELLTLGGKLAGLTTTQVDDLAAVDALLLVETVGSFLGGGQKTGQT